MSTTKTRGGWTGAQAVAPMGALPPGYEFVPPADRMQGRPSRNALTAKGAKAAAAKPAAPTTATRERLLDRAVLCGVIGNHMRSHYASAYDADPSGTRAFLASIGLRDEAAEVHPTVQASPAASAASESYDPSMLTDGERANLQAAREGRPHTRIVGER